MKWKYMICSILTFFLLLASGQAIELDLKSTHALLINLDEQKVLYENQAQEQTAIASLTKIMTSIIALENIESLDEVVTLTASDFRGLAEQNAAVAGFRIGQRVTYRDLLYGLMLPSGADAAQALTRLVAGSRENFVSKMNEKAKELGLTNTHFVNETGLDIANHYSSLEDVAKMFQYALQKDDFRTIISSSSYELSDSSKTLQSTVARNIKRNNISMDYLIGGKTGTTENAGLCLASIARANGTNYMLITTGAPQENNRPYNFLDSKTIYDYFIANFGIHTLIEKGTEILSLNTIYAKENQITFSLPESISKYVSNDFDASALKYEYLGTQEVKYNTPQNTKLGTLKILLEGETLKTIDIILTESLHFDFLKYLQSHPIWIVGFVLVVFGITILLFQRKKKRNKKRKKR